jgi:hypothetical protein
MLQVDFSSVICQITFSSQTDITEEREETQFIQFCDLWHTLWVPHHATSSSNSHSQNVPFSLSSVVKSCISQFSLVIQTIFCIFTMHYYNFCLIYFLGKINTW